MSLFAATGVQYANEPDPIHPPDPATEAAHERSLAALLRVGIDPCAEAPLPEGTWAPMHRAMAAADRASPMGTTVESPRAWMLAYAEACEAEAARFEAEVAT